VSRRPPSLEKLLEQTQGPRPVAFVLAGHNGSGKSTLWYSRLAASLRMPLINADRMMMSILPDADPRTGHIPPWAQQLRDDDLKWQILSQEGVRAFKSLVMDQRMPFAFETVFSHWKPLPGGGHESKADDIRAMQQAGYFVVLLFVGLVSVDMSVFRVSTRKQQGGHDVDRRKLIERFPPHPGGGRACGADREHDAHVRQQPLRERRLRAGAGAGEEVGSVRRARSAVQDRSSTPCRVRSVAGEGRGAVQAAAHFAAEEDCTGTSAWREHPMSTAVTPQALVDLPGALRLTLAAPARAASH